MRRNIPSTHAGRFDNVRARERFLYRETLESPDATPGAQPDKQPRASSYDYARATVYTLLLAGTVILTASFIDNDPEQLKSIAQATVPALKPHEPPMAAASTMQTDVKETAVEIQSQPPVTDCQRDQSSNLCADSHHMAKTAWLYFANNFKPSTGLVNSVEDHSSTTMWDTGSSLGAFIAARDFNLISQYEFDKAVMALLETLGTMPLFENLAPNILYHSNTARMLDNGNNVTDQGIGVSSLDLSRLALWLDTLQCMHPKYYNPVNQTLSRWDYTHLLADEQIYGLARADGGKGPMISVQQGRLGYEQYAGKIFESMGFSAKTSSSYNNKFRTNTEILGVPIAHDTRDPRLWGVNNFVVTDSYTIDAMELGLDDENTPLLKNIFEVQKKRWIETGIPTAISDDNINQEPYYLYNTLFSAGLTFTTTTDTGIAYSDLKSISTKSAISMAVLFQTTITVKHLWHLLKVPTTQNAVGFPAYLKTEDSMTLPPLTPTALF